MKKIIFILLMFFLLIEHSFAQDTLKDKRNFFLIKYNPTSVFGDYITTSSAISFDFEIKIKNDLSYEQTFDYIFLAKKMGGMFSVFVDKINGIRTDSEIKKYLNKKDVNLTGFYLSTHILYQYTDAKMALLNTKVFRNLFAIHEKIGWQYISKTGFVFNVALGFGTRYTTAKTVGYKGEYIGRSNEMSPIYWYDKLYGCGSKWFFSGIGDFKIGWLINYKNK